MCIIFNDDLNIPYIGDISTGVLLLRIGYLDKKIAGNLIWHWYSGPQEGDLMIGGNSVNNPPDYLS